MTKRVLGDEAAQIPPEWYAGDWDSLERLLDRLYRRRDRVRELILSARNSGREPFPNWKVKHACTNVTALRVPRGALSAQSDPR